MQETKQLAASLAAYVRPNDVLVLIGSLGAGKTQFAQGIAEGLGICEHITSPTFNIQLDYEGERLALHHFDLYRLETEDELDDIGFYETLESGGVSLIEWGNKFPHALPESYVEIDIQKSSNTPDERAVNVRGFGKSSHELLVRWARDAESCLEQGAK